MSKQTPTTVKCPLEKQAGEEGAGQSGHPVLSRVDCVAHLVMSEAEDPERCTEAADAMKCIAVLTESVAEMGVQDRIEKSDLRAQVARLQHQLWWRTISLEILLLGVAAISAVMWLTRWWPWR